MSSAPAMEEARRRLRLGVTGGLMLTVVVAGFFLATLESVVSRLGIEQLDAPPAASWPPTGRRSRPRWPKP